jgi:uncharacterized membrane protein YfcA
LYTAFTGTTGATAILIFLLLFLNILPNQTVIAGTMLFVSCLPLGIFGIYDFYKNNKINYTFASAIIVGISVGIYFGSRYAIEVNKILGEKTGDKIKFGLTAFIYGILSLLYLYQLYMT